LAVTGVKQPMIWDILFKVWKKGSSFNGENEYISVSNSVIILDGKNEICYGGDLKTTNLSGEENTYQVQLKTTEITKEVKK
jgi:hypothetical protein